MILATYVGLGICRAELDYHGSPDRLQIAINEENVVNEEEQEFEEQEVKLTREEIIFKFQVERKKDFENH